MSDPGKQNGHSPVQSSPSLSLMVGCVVGGDLAMSASGGAHDIPSHYNIVC